MRYPYFINPDIDALPEATGEERSRLIRHIAACVGDEATLRSLIGIDPAEFAQFYPDMTPPELSTEDTISSFIDRFSSEKKAEAPTIEEIIPAPAIDYASMLDDGEDTPSDSPAVSDATGDAISAFLAAVPPKKPARRHPAENDTVSEAKETVSETVSDEKAKPEHADGNLSEALFKLMVKNKNYAKALEIINELSLNNPKKSVYFAYQMRFLKKLIKNQESASQNTH